MSYIQTPSGEHSFMYTVCYYVSPLVHAPLDHVSFCLMKNALKCDNCQPQVAPSTISWMNVHLATREFVVSD